jgi:N-acetylmuramoyl-L-alanine amidase
MVTQNNRLSFMPFASDSARPIALPDGAGPGPAVSQDVEGQGRELVPVLGWRRGLVLGLVAFAPLLTLGAVVAVNMATGQPTFPPSYAARIELPANAVQIGLPPIEGPADPTRPLVVIDAGHGGHDPGAHGPASGGGTHIEKDMTLALALALRDQLLAKGGVRVALTRNTDRYLLLEERSGIARRMKADLFISIHADSAEVEGASGATIYTLSPRGSSEEAERLANAENRADTVNGVPLAQTSSSVSAILVDLAQRHVAELADDFVKLVLREGDGHITFRANPVQSAAFVVLKSPDVPSVLFEAGYITNPKDAERLHSPQGRSEFASAMAQAVRLFFVRERSAEVLPAGM